MAPLRPWALVSLPTRSCCLGCFGSAGLSLTVSSVDEIDANATTVGQGVHDGAEGLCGAAGTADHPAEVLGVHTNLEDLAARRLLRDDVHIVWMVDDALDQVLQSG